ncbi:MAG TPA: AIPR family protein [Pyrinomonadaceae bacterium]|nr:AIPR family protein [Pyrinomonadaceae bacterium]
MDPTLTMERLTYALDSRFAGLIDMSDYQSEPKEEQRTKFLSRALAAFCIQCLTDADPAVAAQSVTDGYQDQGLDAIYFDSTENTLYLVQSKWSKNGTKTIESGDCQLFIDGIQSLIRADFSGFNEKIRKREAEMRANLLMRSDVRVVLVPCYTSPHELAEPIQKALAIFLRRQNNVGEQDVFTLETLNLKRLYSHLTGSASSKINLTIALSEWGKMDTPYRAFYGQVKLVDVAQWSQHGRALWARNLRFYRGATEVNDAMENTVLKDPERFWYFNNGITLLCNKVQKTLINGDARDYGIFECEGVSIVNGAQTVGVVWELNRKDPAHLGALDSRVHLRMISLENCPAEFGIDLTRATNTQNRILNRDFAALDPNQQRLAIEMSMDGRRYAFKSGDQDPKNGEGCNIVEATVALACANEDVTLAVQAKREVSQLWYDIEKPPYTTLFNEQLTAKPMWRSVLILRAVQKQLAELDKSDLIRGDWLAIHGNRFILHRVFLDPVVKNFRNPQLEEQEILAAASVATSEVLRDLSQLVQERHPNAYLANLFKNTQKCKSLDHRLSNPTEYQETDPDLDLPLFEILFKKDEKD